jgi:hypothetical protein
LSSGRKIGPTFAACRPCRTERADSIRQFTDGIHIRAKFCRRIAHKILRQTPALLHNRQGRFFIAEEESVFVLQNALGYSWRCKFCSAGVPALEDARVALSRLETRHVCQSDKSFVGMVFRNQQKYLEQLLDSMALKT